MTNTKQPEQSSRLLIGMFLSATFLYWITLYLYVPTLPSYILTKTVNLAMVGVVLSMYGLLQALIRIPVGVAVDATGTGKPFIIGGFLFGAAGALVMGLGESLGLMTLGRALTGLAAATWVPLVAVFSRMFPRDRVIIATSVLAFTGSIGRMLATGVNGLLNTWGGYRLAFVLAAVASAAAIVIIIFTKLERSEPRRPSPRAIIGIVTRPDVILPTLISAVIQFASWAVSLSFLPILAQNMGAGDNIKSFLVSLNIGASTVGNLLSTVLARRFKPSSVLFFSTLLVCLGIAGTAISPSIPYLFVCMFIMGLANGVGYPTLMGMSIQKIEPAQRNTAMGTHQSIYAVGMFTGPWVGGIIADAVGIRVMFGIVAGAALAAAYLLILILRRAKQ